MLCIYLGTFKKYKLMLSAYMVIAKEFKNPARHITLATHFLSLKRGWKQSTQEVNTAAITKQEMMLLIDVMQADYTHSVTRRESNAAAVLANFLC